jgi:hypothetical protein
MGVAWALLIILVVFLLIALVPSTCTSVCCLHLMVVVFKPVLNFSLMSVLMHVHPGYRGLLRRQRTYGETSSAQSPVTHCFHLRITSTLLSLLKLHQFCRWYYSAFGWISLLFSIDIMLGYIVVKTLAQTLKHTIIILHAHAFQIRIHFWHTLLPIVVISSLFLYGSIWMPGSMRWNMKYFPKDSSLAVWHQKLRTHAHFFFTHFELPPV